MIRFENISKSFGNLTVLDDFSLTIQKGSINAILGPNGSGKTTLIKCLLGMVLPDSGEIYLNDEAVRSKYAYRSQIDYMPQIANFPANLKVKEVIAMLKDIRGQKARDKELLEYFEIEGYLNKQLSHLY